MNLSGLKFSIILFGLSWLLTLPIAALISAAAFQLLTLLLQR